MNTEVNYNLNKKRLVEAKMARIVGTIFIKVPAKILAGLGLVAAVLSVCASFWNVLDFGFGPALWLTVLIGLLAAWILNLASFLTAEEQEFVLRAGAPADLGQSADWGATILLSKINPKSPDLAQFFKLLEATPEVNFVLEELLPNEEFWTFLKAGTGESGYYGKVLQAAVEAAAVHGTPLVSVANLFWGALIVNENYQKLLLDLEIDESDLQNIFFLESRYFYGQKYPITATEHLKSHSSGVAQNWDFGYTLFLDRFAHNLMAPDQGDFSIEGRTKIEAEIENILTKQSKNNVILTGPVGTGKTTIIKGLISKIAWGKSLPALAYQRVVELDLGAIISYASDRSALEQVILSVFNDAVRAGNIIIYVPEIQELFAGGSKEGTIDGSEIILPYLKNSSLRIIGATTEKGYGTYLEAKPELAAEFTKISVSPTAKEETLRVMAEVSIAYRALYGTQFSYRALKETYALAEHFVTEKEFPGKAIDMLENIATAAKNEGLKRLDKETVQRLAEKDLNVKVTQATGDEKAKLLNLEAEIHSRVIGQIQAVNAVADALRRARAQIKNQNRPAGSFLFMGPTGVGKTELAKALAAAYFGEDSQLIRMDMNEFQDSTAIGRFIGQKAAGSDELEGGEFVKKVRSNPFSVILLDEIEKANSNILDLFLQALDEGYITDGMGERVNLNSAIIIATSNAGANSIRKLVELNDNDQHIKEVVLEEVQNSGTFKPEFLNRFDGVIIFRSLSASEILAVAELMFAEIQADFKTKGYDIELSEGVLARLAQEGYVPEMGARPMRRVFQDRLESYLAKKMLEDAIPKSEPFVVQAADIY